MVKFNSPSELLTPATSLLGKHSSAPSNPLFKKCYYNQYISEPNLPPWDLLLEKLFVYLDSQLQAGY